MKDSLLKILSWFYEPDANSSDAAIKAICGGILIVGLVFAAGKAIALENIPPEVVSYYEDSVWSVSSPIGGGSAFHISPTFLITNKHVADILPKGKGTMWKTTTLRNYEVEVVGVSRIYDLAVLYCAQCLHMTPQILTIQDRYFGVGTATYGGGYGFGLFAIHAGYIQAFNFWTYSITTDTIAQPGDSGSPQIVVNEDGSMSLVGVRKARKDHTVLLEPAGAVAGFMRRIGLGFLL